MSDIDLGLRMRIGQVSIDLSSIATEMLVNEWTIAVLDSIDR
jgi:hypothetical protein